MTLALRAGAATSVGRVRPSNQDSVLAAEDLAVFAVADGMGGHAGGEVASTLALEALLGARTDDGLESLLRAVGEANRAVFVRSLSQPELRGMGTTLTIVAFVTMGGERRIAIVNVGDSRAYMVLDGELRQVTRDHSYVQDLIDAGQITPDEAMHHPHRNVITRSVGIDREVTPDSWEVTPAVGDRFLICSDGLTNEVSEAEILDVLRSERDRQVAADRLVAMAEEAGGRDNISVVVVDVVELDADGNEIERPPAAATALATVPPDTLTATGELPVLPPPPLAGDRAADAGGDPTAGPAPDPDTVELLLAPPPEPPLRSLAHDAPSLIAFGPPGPAVAPEPVTEPMPSLPPPPVPPLPPPDAAIAAAATFGPPAAPGTAPPAAPPPVPPSAARPTPEPSGRAAPRPIVAPEPPAEPAPLPLRRRGSPVRAAVFVGLLLGLLVVAGALVWYYANRQYFLAEHEQKLALYQGQPGGFLWFQPSVVTTYDLAFGDLTPAQQAELLRCSQGDRVQAEDCARRLVAQFSTSGPTVTVPAGSGVATTAVPTTAVPPTAVPTTAMTTTAASVTAGPTTAVQPPATAPTTLRP